MEKERRAQGVLKGPHTDVTQAETTGKGAAGEQGVPGKSQETAEQRPALTKRGTDIRK